MPATIQDNSPFNPPVIQPSTVVEPTVPASALLPKSPKKAKTKLTPEQETAKASALAKLGLAERDLCTAERKTGTMYATALRAVIEAVANKATNKELAVAIASAYDATGTRTIVTHASGKVTDKTAPYTGRAARYRVLARYEVGNYKDSETKPTEPIKVNGRGFVSPITALESGEVSWTATYNAFVATINPTKKDMTDFSDSVMRAAERAALKWRIRARVESKADPTLDSVVSILVMDNQDALYGALRALARKAKDSLPAAKMERVIKALGQADTETS